MFSKRARTSTSSLATSRPSGASTPIYGNTNQVQGDGKLQCDQQRDGKGDWKFAPRSSSFRRSHQSSLATLNETEYSDYDPMSADINKMSDNELRFRIRLVEAENRRLIACQGRVMADCSRKIEMHMNEVRMLREDVRRLNVESRELRDLSCFLDDERNRAKRLSREWQRFGRYTNAVMKQELAAHQAKVLELQESNKQLTEANNELKQLCLYLDDQRAAVSCMSRSRCMEANSTSSESTDDQHKPESEQKHNQASTSNGSLKANHSETEDSGHFSTPAMSPSLTSHDAPIVDHEQTLPPIEEHHEHLLNYIRSLESRVDHLEQCQNPHSQVPHADQQTMTTSLISTCSSIGTVHASSQSASSNTMMSASSSVSQQTMVFAVQVGIARAHDDTDDEAGEYDLSPIREEPAEIEDSPLGKRPKESRVNCMVKKAGSFLRNARCRLSLSDPTSLSTKGQQKHVSRRLFRSNSLRHGQKSSSTQDLPLVNEPSSSASLDIFLKNHFGQSEERVTVSDGHKISQSATFAESKSINGELSRAVEKLRIEESLNNNNDVEEKCHYETLLRKPTRIPVSFGRLPSVVPGSPKCSAV